MTSLLVTGAGGPAGRALGAQLAARAGAGADLTWVGVDIAPVTDPHFPATDHAPRADGWDYATGMRDLIDKHAPDLVIPTVQDELPQVAVLAEALGRATPGGATGALRAANGMPGPAGAVVTAAPGSAAIAADKLLTMLALDRTGVPVPRHALTTDFASMREALAWARGPIVIKPRVSRGGRGVRLIESSEDMPGPPNWDRLDASWIVQPFAGGTEYNPQVYRSPSGESHVVVLEKTVLKQGRVGNAAAVVRLAERAVPDVEETARRAADALDLVGPIDMDVRRDVTGKPVVLEVNGRFGANCAHAPELLDAVLALRAAPELWGPRRAAPQPEKQSHGRPPT
ncbi:ATP-grasp domain-containing protein [Promicromonospora panici]|uniref:ATP-grasp domain-containing protein n=1 Tax=Promicromonospora panici TaxID=2219658 RepID=UPI00101D7389|nr:ATP-grasp domain-containing protein [Promicromonospora panici]